MVTPGFDWFDNEFFEDNTTPEERAEARAKAEQEVMESDGD